MTVNILGSLLMGLTVAYFAFKGDAPQGWRLFLTTGILGQECPPIIGKLRGLILGTKRTSVWRRLKATQSGH